MNWKKRKRRTRLAKANGFNHYHQYREYVKYSVKLDGLIKKIIREPIPPEPPYDTLVFPPLHKLTVPVIMQSEINRVKAEKPNTRVQKFMEFLVKETWCTETYCDDDPFDYLKEDDEDDESV
jgi:hypothetical protein